MCAEQWVVDDFERSAAVLCGVVGSIVRLQQLDETHPRIEVVRRDRGPLFEQPDGSSVMSV